MSLIYDYTVHQLYNPDNYVAFTSFKHRIYDLWWNRENAIKIGKWGKEFVKKAKIPKKVKEKDKIHLLWVDSGRKVQLSTFRRRLRTWESIENAWKQREYKANSHNIYVL